MTHIAPTPPSVDVRRLVRIANRGLGRLSEAVARAAADEPALLPLSNCLAEAREHGRRFGAAHPVPDRRATAAPRVVPPPVRSGYPLRADGSGRWCKVIDQRRHHFGRLADPSAAERQYLAFMAERLAEVERAAESELARRANPTDAG